MKPALRTAVPLLHREPGRARALARRARSLTPVFEASAYFWAGRTERALSRATNGSSLAALIHVVDAVLAGDGDAARARFAASEELLRSTSMASGDVLAIEGFLAFFEERFDLARARLDVVAAAFPTQPIGTAARFFLAAIAHRTGDARRARALLAGVLRTGVGSRVLEAAREEWATHASGPVPTPRRPNVVSRLARDLVTGLRLAFFLPLRTPFARGAVTRLLVFDLALAFALRFVDWERGATVAPSGLALILLPIVAVASGSWLVTRSSGAFRRLAGGALATMPLLAVSLFALAHHHTLGPATLGRALTFVVVLWTLAVALRVGGVSRARGRGIAVGLALFALFVVPTRAASAVHLFVAPAADVVQSDRLARAETAIAPERPGQVDLYVVGGAGWAFQDVFLQEARSAQRLVGRRYQAEGRSILLANDAFTHEDLPLLTESSLHHAVGVVGKRMNPSEDVLFLYLTSHGSSRGLALSFGADTELEPQTLEPAALRAILDQAGIRWRVIVVQGCESGVFIDALKDDHTLVATAASNDRPSYGCADGNSYTDFGRAFLFDKLAPSSSLATALREAGDLVTAQETRDGRLPSRPQIAVGSEIEAKLAALEAR